MTIEDIQDAIDAVLGGADGRDLTDEESATIEAHEAELVTAQARRDRTEALRARQAERAQVATANLVTGSRAPKADDTLTRAFTDYLRTGKENADLQELRAAQSEGTPSEGGFLVPEEVRNKIVTRMKAFGGLASVVDEITTPDGRDLKWLVEGDDTSNRAEQVDEGGTFVGGADLSWSKASLGAYSYMAGGAGGNPLRVSRELVQDTGYDVVGRISDKLGERGARLRAQLLVNGSGVNAPQGIITGRTGVTTAANNALTYADFLTWIHSLDPAYRNENCRWAFNDAFLQTIRGKLDANGRPLLVDSTAGIEGRPGGATLLGYPVTIDQGFSNFNNASPTTNFGVFGDLKAGYVVRNVKSHRAAGQPVLADAEPADRVQRLVPVRRPAAGHERLRRADGSRPDREHPQGPHQGQALPTPRRPSAWGSARSRTRRTARPSTA
jgi:HK97 family phage major capsid protein